MKKTFEVSKDLKTGKDKLRIIIPLLTLKLLIKGLSVPLSAANKPGGDKKVADFILCGFIRPS